MVNNAAVNIIMHISFELVFNPLLHLTNIYYAFSSFLITAVRLLNIQHFIYIYMYIYMMHIYACNIAYVYGMLNETKFFPCMRTLL